MERDHIAAYFLIKLLKGLEVAGEDEDLAGEAREGAPPVPPCL